MNPFSHFIDLAKKSFFRTPYWERNLVVKILIGFFVLYLVATFLFLGVGLYFILDEASENSTPFEILNSILVFYFFFELVFRYFLQNLPVTQIQHYITLPIPKRKIVNWVLLRSGLSLYNILPWILFLPFAVVASVQEGLSLGIWAWWVSVLLLVLSLNYIVFLLNKNTTFFVATVGVIAALVFLENKEIFPLISTSGTAFQSILTQPWWALIPMLIFGLTLHGTRKYLIGQFYLDQGLKKKSEKVIGTGLAYFDKLGLIGSFLKNDIRLVIRNIRARQVLIMGVLFLFYGLIFYTSDIYAENDVIKIFAAMIISGGFMLSFGQYVPAWDSEYYSFLMCQNIPYIKYLESKWFLMVCTVAIAAILAIPYVFFGWDIYKIILATAFFNMGFGSFITLYSGALNRNPLKLNVKAKAFENTQAFNLTQMLFSLPKIGLPILFFLLPNHFFGFDMGIYCLGGAGILGMLLKNPLLNHVEKIYQKGKYKTIAAFNKSN